MTIRDRSRCWLTPWTRVSSLLLAVALVPLGISLDIVDSARAQSASPLSIQPQTGRVGIGTSTPAFSLDVAGTVNATGFRGDGSQLSNLPAASQWTANG